MKAKRLTLGAAGLLGALAIGFFALNWPAVEETQAQSNECLVRINTQQFPYCLEVVKQTDPDGSNEEFSFLVEVASKEVIPFHFSLSDDESHFVPVFPGDQVLIQEDDESDWELDDVDCDGDYVVIDEGEDFIVIEITPGPGDSPPEVVCVFENTEDEDEGNVRGNPGGIFGGVNTAQQNRERAGAAAAAAAAAPPTTVPAVRPPSTGDGGLLP